MKTDVVALYKLECLVFWTLGWHHKISVETCCVYYLLGFFFPHISTWSPYVSLCGIPSLFKTPEQSCGLENEKIGEISISGELSLYLMHWAAFLKWAVVRMDGEQQRLKRILFTMQPVFPAEAEGIREELRLV